ncbi:MAG: ribosome biogenesis GTPase Der [Planctomycetes bacterium]|nr:ribosome biogenesis GTPase Der [Planctomycetota bacterium]
MKVGIIGRTNVGKSTLFNALAGRRRAIMADIPNTTRDIISTQININNKAITIYDLPGWELFRDFFLTNPLIKEINLMLFVVDAKEEPTPFDKDIYLWLKKSGQKFILVINKIDDKKLEILQYNFTEFTSDISIPISSYHKTNLDLLQSSIEQNFVGSETLQPQLSTVIVGKQNVGKSTLLNSLCGFYRSTVSPERGTTRDYIEHTITFKTTNIKLIDTAGYFKKKHTKTIIDIAVHSKIIEACESADVIIFLLDCTTKVATFEKRLAQLIKEMHKPCVICVNKSDLLKDTQKSSFTKQIREELHFVNYAPFIFISALRNSNLDSLLDSVVHLNNNFHEKADLNFKEIIEDIIARRPPPLVGTKTAIVYKISAKERNTVELTVNDSKIFSDPYLRSIENELRQNGYFLHLPSKIILKGKSKHSH